ncbi:MAG TPA: YgcG family protein, partial [Aquabacterium sp.]|nr:YgcG family protein [Aquabacterium sp.]
FAGGLNLAVDQLSARIRGENLPSPSATAKRSNQGSSWQDLGIFLFMGAPIAGAVLTSIFGRKLGSLAAGLAIGALGWWWTSSLIIALVAGVLAIVLVGALGVGSSRSNGRHHGGWGGGGFGGGGGGFGGSGGFSSGGGGSFGGGGSSGNW